MGCHIFAWSGGPPSFGTILIINFNESSWAGAPGGL